MPNNNNNKNPTKSKSAKRRRSKNKKRIEVQTTAPVAIQRHVTARSPVFKQTNSGVTVTHREFVADVVRGTNNFAADRYDINPGLAGSFPWLSQVAGRFESYTFKRLDFVYQPMVATSQAGSVMMAIDFDALDSIPSTKTTIMSYKGAVRTAPWQSVKLATSSVDTHKMVAERYQRSGAISAGDLKTYDVGALYLATVGTGTTPVTLGELYVEYTILLRTPQIQTSPGLALQMRTVQTGTLTWDTAVRSHIGNIVGEGPVAGLLADPLTLSNFLYIHPAYRRFLLLLRTVPAAGSTFRAIGSVLRNTKVSDNGTGLLVTTFSAPGNPAASQTSAWGTIANMAQANPASGSTEPLYEFHVIQDANERKDRVIFGSQSSSWNLELRGTDAYNGTAGMITNYTIIPLDNEIWPQGTPSTITGSSVSAPKTVFQWPRDLTPIISREGTVINRLTYNHKVVEPAVEEKPDKRRV